MKKALEGSGEKGDCHRACYEERFDRLERSNNDLRSQIKSFTTAVDSALSSFFHKVESLITEGRVASHAPSDEAVPSTSFASNPQKTSVTEAAAAGDAVEPSRMLGDPNARDSKGVPAPFLAASGDPRKSRYPQAVDALLKGGAEVELGGPWLRIAPHEAADKGHVEVVRRPSYTKSPCVVWEFEKCYPGVVRRDAGRAMIQAAGRGNIESMTALLDAGIDINYQNELGWTALMWASWNGRVECVKDLVRRGVHLDACNESGCTALHYAALGGKEEVVCILLEFGADANVKDKEGRKPKDYVRARAMKKSLFSTQ